VAFVAQETGDIDDTATVTSATPDPNKDNNAAKGRVSFGATADVSLVKTSDATTYKPSSRIAYQLTVANNGPSKAQGIVVTDNLPDVKQAIYESDTGGCVRSGTVLTCQLGDLNAGASRTFYIYVTVKGARGEVSNTASVTSLTADGNLSNNISTRVVTVQGGQP